MAKLTDFTNPISGGKGNVFDLKGIWSMILGVFVLMFVFATGQKVANAVSSKVPALDTRVEQLTYPHPQVQTSSRYLVS